MGKTQICLLFFSNVKKPKTNAFPESLFCETQLSLVSAKSRLKVMFNFILFIISYCTLFSVLFLPFLKFLWSSCSLVKVLISRHSNCSWQHAALRLSFHNIFQIYTYKKFNRNTERIAWGQTLVGALLHTFNLLTSDCLLISMLFQTQWVVCFSLSAVHFYSAVWPDKCKVSIMKVKDSASVINGKH